MNYTLSENESFGIKRGSVNVEVPLEENGRVALTSGLRYSFDRQGRTVTNVCKLPDDAFPVQYPTGEGSYTLYEDDVEIRRIAIPMYGEYVLVHKELDNMIVWFDEQGEIISATQGCTFNGEASTRLIVENKVEMLDRTINRLALTTDIANLKVYFPPMSDDGKVRDFLFALTCSGTPPSITYGGYNIVLKEEGADIVPGVGSNLFSYTEVSRNQYVVSRKQLVEVQDNTPTTYADLIQAMIQCGYDTAAFNSLDDVKIALGLPVSATLTDCAVKVLYS